jgi:hypothetical protein
VRAVGTVIKGMLAFRPNENPQGDYFVVTKAYVLYFNYLQGYSQEQEAIIESLRAKLAEKK